MIKIEVSINEFIQIDLGGTRRLVQVVGTNTKQRDMYECINLNISYIHPGKPGIMLEGQIHINLQV